VLVAFALAAVVLRGRRAAVSAEARPAGHEPEAVVRAGG